MCQEPIPMAENAGPEAVAYDLMRDIMFEDPNRPAPNLAPFRAYVLDLYAECLVAVAGKRVVTSPPPDTATRKPTIVENDNSAAPLKHIDPMRKKRLQQAHA